MRGQDLVDAVGATESGQTGDRQHQRLGLPAIELGEPRVDVPVQRVERQVRTSRAQERDPAWAVGADASTRGQRVQACAAHATHQRIARILSLRVGGDDELGMLVGRDVLGAVDRDIDLPADERVDDARDERAFAPGGVGGAVVAVGADDDELAADVEFGKSLRDPTGLDHRQRAATRADSLGAGRHGGWVVLGE